MNVYPNIYLGDAGKVLKELEENSVDLIFTSPPYSDSRKSTYGGIPPDKYYNASHFVKDRGKRVDREIDFYLLNNGKKYLCEIKLMGKGNPESADSIIARDSNVFIAILYRSKIKINVKNRECFG